MSNYTATDRKVYAFLRYAYMEFKKESRTSIVAMCKDHTLAKEYGSFLIDDGTLVNTRGGKCGPATRKWVGKSPTLPLAVFYVDKFNKSREKDRNKLKASIKKQLSTGNAEIYSMLISVGAQLENIQKALKTKTA